MDEDKDLIPIILPCHVGTAALESLRSVHGTELDHGDIGSKIMA